VDKSEFIIFRKKLGKTQTQMAQLLGVSLKAIHSYEQGWRTIPAHAERQLFFLVSRIRGMKKSQKPCWTVNKCPKNRKEKCPAWEFQVGALCWFINGTICGGETHSTWKDKIRVCRSCEMLRRTLDL
jgi:hypothetical protein